MEDSTQRTSPTLGVVGISKNEERDLPGFLEHLLPWVDEIVVVDDGSTDATQEILRHAGPKVKLIEHRMTAEAGFAGQRNRGIQEARSEWLLHMDIDERVPPQLAAEILEAIRSDQYNAYRYHRLNFFLHRAMKGGGFQDWNHPQLARKGKHHFENVVHETCIVENAPGAIGQLKSQMWHLNDESYTERMEKSMVYCQYQRKRLVDRGVTMKWYDFFLFPIGEFVRKFVLKQGYQDRTPGLLFAIHSACAIFRACALVWDEQHRLDRTELDESIRIMWENDHGWYEKTAGEYR